MVTLAERRHAVVTGANGVIGLAIAQGLADAGFDVTLIARDAGKGARARDVVVGAHPDREVRLELTDLSSKASVRSLAERLDRPVHVLVNNAAVAPRARRETEEGIELSFATNVLGYVWMTEALRPRLEDAARPDAPARVINVASYWAGGLDVDDLEFRRRRYDNDAAYRQSKQANRMLTVAFAERWSPARVTVHACHPGDVASRLASDLGFGGHQTAEECAETPVWLASCDEAAHRTGGYYARRRLASCEFAHDRSAIERLWSACAAYA
jgi:NAD(P)-dependent dehydrogenase (short-subunit alcohol dehydrogenase family)